MNSERWDQVQTLFKEIISLDRDTRDTRLAELKKNDPELFDEISSLLIADADDSSILEKMVLDSYDFLELLSMEGTRVGPYKIIRQVGSGGMGNVYLAERVEGGFEQQVALKLIKYGMDSEQILRRFESERNILARLQHPHIARLLDGGLAGDNRPWFAMEYVQGEPIDQYTGRRNLSTKEKLHLFMNVASAVQYAHRNLVVHRDLKPGNIMVIDEEGIPQVKLLDFGIARLLDDDQDSFGITRQGIRPMTRAYASPEQLKGEPVTTASDIYTLGVILYELLSGRRPFEQGEMSSAEFEDMICNSDPVRPSQVLDESFISDQLEKQLKGDLDMICLKALRHEPERRYETVGQFADDIRKHLEGMPVLARPESRSYRIQKFVSRHKTAVLAAVLLFLSMAGGITAFAWQYRVAALERDRAQREAATATEVAGFLQGLFEVVDPAISNGDTLTARQLLDRGAERISRELENQPEVLARMLDVLGNAYMSLWLFDEAETMFDGALRIRRNLYDDVHAEVATSYQNLGEVHLQKGAYAKSDSLLTNALKIRQQIFDQNHADIASVYEALGLLYEKQGKYERSEEHYFKAIEIFESQTSGGYGLQIAGIKNNLGNLFQETGELERSEEYLREALTYNRSHYQSDHPSIGTNINNLARTLNMRAKYDEAEDLFLQSLEIAGRFYGPRHPLTALSMNNYSGFLKDRERYALAEKFQKEALDIFLKSLGEDHPYIAMSYNNLANLRSDQGDYETAAEYHQKALDRNREIYGDDHDTVANSLHNLGVVRLDQEQYREAEGLFRKALRIDKQQFGEHHPYVAMDFQSVGIALLEQGDLKAAEEHISHSIALNSEVLGEVHPNTVIAKGELGRVLLRKGDIEDAIEILREVVERHEQDQPVNSWRKAEIRSLLGECLTKTGNLREAEIHLTEGYPILVEAMGEDHRFTRRARERLVELYEALGRPDKADQYRD